MKLRTKNILAAAVFFSMSLGTYAGVDDTIDCIDSHMGNIVSNIDALQAFSDSEDNMSGPDVYDYFDEDTNTLTQEKLTEYIADFDEHKRSIDGVSSAATSLAAIKICTWQFCTEITENYDDGTVLQKCLDDMSESLDF